MQNVMECFQLRKQSQLKLKSYIGKLKLGVKACNFALNYFLQ